MSYLATPMAWALGQAFVVIVPTTAAACCPSDEHHVIAMSVAETGLGDVQPQAPNVSTSAAFKAYMFQKDGFRYFQLVGADRVVRAAFGVTGVGQVFQLPIGHDPVREVTDLNAGILIYKGPDVSIAYSLATDGVITWLITTQRPN